MLTMIRGRVALWMAAVLLPLSAQAVDVQISSLIDTPDPAIRTGEVTYDISVRNSTADTASNVTLAVPLPATTSFVSVDHGSCVHDGGNPGTLNCSFGDITGDGFGNPVESVSLVLRTSAATGATISLSATASTDSADTNLGNNSLSQNTTIDNGADLTVSLSDNPDPVVAGASLVYTLVVNNAGPNDASTVSVVTDLTPGVTYQSFSGSGWSCGAAGQTVTCSRSSIANGANAPNLLINTVANGAQFGQVTTAATVSAATGDPVPNNNTVTENTQINAGTDLSISKTADANVVANQNFTFTLATQNLGPMAAGATTVSDTLPGTVAYVSVAAPGWSCSHTGEPTGGTLTCTIADYVVGSQANIVVTATAPASGSFTNTATITGSIADANNGNNSSSVTRTVVADGADLSITKSKSPNPVAQGSNVTSVIRVSNAGPRATSGTLTVVDSLPAGETYVSFSGSNWSCTHNAGDVTCEYSATPLGVGANTSNLSIVSTATGSGDLTNSATVTDVGGETDPNAANNTRTATVSSTVQIADLSIVKNATTVGADTVLATGEDTITYTLQVTNNGPNDLNGTDANAVVVTDNIPHYVSGVVGATPSASQIAVSDDSGGRFTCTTGSTVTCRLNNGQTLSNAETVTFTITAARPLLDGSRTNTARVSSSVLGDDDRGNNSDTASVTVDPIADVEIQSVVVTPDPAKAGTEASVVISYRNNGPSRATGVELTNTFTPGGRSYTLISASGGCGGLVGDVVTCTIGNLNRNQVGSVTLVVRPEWDANNDSWSMGIASAITTATVESDPNNNEGSATINVTPAEIDLLVNDTDQVDPLGYTPTPGGFPATLDNVIVYKIDTTNRGPSLATGVVLTDVMTPKATKQLTFLCDATGATSCSGGTSVCDNQGVSVTGPASLSLSCSLPDMAADTTHTRYLYFRVDGSPDSTGDTHNNQASVSANEDDTLGANDSEAETTTVRTLADIGITVVPSTTPVDVNEPFEWDLTVTNNGPGKSDDTTVTATLPAGNVLTGPPVPDQGTCTGVAGDTSYTCNLGTVLSGDSTIIDVPVRATVYPPGGTLTHTVNVSNVGLDNNPANDSDSATVTVVKSSVAGVVFNDINDNGVQNPEDSGIAGVSLALNGTDNYGNAISASATTQADGSYLFDNLPASDGSGYTVTETQPAGFGDGLENVSGVVVPNTRSTDVHSAIAVAKNTAVSSYNFAELGQASLSGRVWLDLDRDGTQNGSEAGLQGVVITLNGTETDTALVISVATTTDADGNYSFVDLRPGTYRLTQTQPTAWADGVVVVGSAGGTGGVNQITAISLASGVTGSDYNFGERAASLTGTVYIDANSNSLLDTGEQRLSGVAVRVTGTDVNGQPVARSGVTNGTGDFAFLDLPAVNGSGYSLIETHPSAYGDRDETAGNFGGVVENDIISQIPLAAGAQGTGYLFGEGQKLNGVLVGYVYADLNRNGEKDFDEPGIEGVEVRLLGTNIHNETVDLRVTTDTNGLYLFADLSRSNSEGYRIFEIQPAHWEDGEESLGTLGGEIGNDRFSGIELFAGGSGMDYNFGEISGASLSGSVWLDHNRNDSQDTDDQGVPGVVVTLRGELDSGISITLTAETNEQGEYEFLALAPGKYSLSEQQPVVWGDGPEQVGSLGGTVGPDSFTDITLELNEKGERYDFIEYSASLSGSVYEDSNGNGQRDDDEAGIDGVVITLTGSDAQQTDISRTALTDSNGDYRFEQLPSASASGYQLNETQPERYEDGSDSAGSLGGVVSDDEISAIALPAGSEATDYLFGEEGLLTATLSGYVYLDRDDNGIKAGDEPGIEGVEVTLTGTDFLGNPVTRVALTDADGLYRFEGVLASDTEGYQLQEAQPLQWFDGKDTQGSAGGQVAANDHFGALVIESGQSADNYNFGERGSSLSGRVYLDLNDNGVPDDDELGIANVEVTLSGNSADGAAVSDSSLTDEFGRYRFDDLPASDSNGYRVQETQPPNTLDGIDRAGSIGGTAGNDLISEVVFANEPVDAVDYDFGEQLEDPATISGTVWLDTNLNRRDDDGGGQPSWTVELFIGSGKNPDDLVVVATTRTDDNGDYQFTDVPDGTYGIRFRHPSGGYIYGPPQSEYAGTEVTPSAIEQLTVKAGDNVVDQDLPIDPSGIVYDSVTREPVADAVVTLIGPAGFDADTHLVGGEGNLAQTTDNTGYYQYLLFSDAPEGEYRIQVDAPSGYREGESENIPACVNTAVVGPVPDPAKVQAQATAPGLEATLHDPLGCASNSSGFAGGDQSTQYYFGFVLSSDSADVVNNHIPLDPAYVDGGLIVTKEASVERASVGDLVAYRIQVINSLLVDQAGIDLIDQLPKGFKYLSGSARLNDLAVEPEVVANTLRWSDVSVPAGETVSLTLVTVVGAGVSEGDYVNRAFMLQAGAPVDEGIDPDTDNNGGDSDGDINAVSTVGSARVTVVADPLFDCTDVIGTVFNDHNVNGYQDDGETGIAGARLATARGLLITTDDAGRYHITCAMVPDALRGSNFIIKLDERTLPSGYRITTENPRVIRLTRGKLGEANFGVALHRVVSLEINGLIFDGDTDAPKAEFEPRLQSLIELLRQQPSVLRLVFVRGDESDEQRQRWLDALQSQLQDLWQQCDCDGELFLETEIRRPDDYQSAATKEGRS